MFSLNYHVARIYIPSRLDDYTFQNHILIHCLKCYRFFQQLYLFWRDSDPINVKYVFFSTTTSTAIIHVCGRTGKELIFNIAGHVLIRFKNFQFIRVTDNDDFLSYNSGKGCTVYIWRVGGFGVLYDGNLFSSTSLLLITGGKFMWVIFRRHVIKYWPTNFKNNRIKILI